MRSYYCADAQVILYTNNAAGDILSLTDGKGQTTRWNYDQYGRVTNKLDQAGTVVLRYNYDADNRLTNRWSAAFANAWLAYDPVGNLASITGISPTLTYQYDALNRLTNMVDGVGTTVYTYDQVGQLLTEVGPFSSDAMTNTYANRLRTSLVLQQPKGLWTNGFLYDAARRLTNVTSPAGAFGYATSRLRPDAFVGAAAPIALQVEGYVRIADFPQRRGNLCGKVILQESRQFGHADFDSCEVRHGRGPALRWRSGRLRRFAGAGKHRGRGREGGVN